MSTRQQKVKDVNIVYVLGKVLRDKTILETIYNLDTQHSSLLFLGLGGDIEEVDEYRNNGTIYRPLDDQNIRRGHVLLPSNYILDNDPQDLVNHIQRLIHKYVDLDPQYEMIAARYVLFTYVFDKFQKSPYLRIMGQYGSGKSRFLDVMSAMCYHSSKMGEGLTPANIYRWLDKYPGTLVIDEADFPSSENFSLIVQIMNGGYHRDGTVTRSEISGNGYEPRVYSTYSPKIVAARGSYNDDALESRFLTQLSHVKTRDIPRSTPKFDEWEEMIDIRNCLLGYRLQHYSDKYPEVTIKGMENFEPRLVEIFTPLLTIMGETELSDEARSFLNQIGDDHLAQLGSSDEGLTVKVICDLLKKGGIKPPTVGRIANEVNRLRVNQPPINDRKMGSLLMGLGIRRHRTNEGYVINIDQQQLQALAKRYGIPL